MWLYGSGFPKSMNIGLAIDKKNGIEIKNNYTGANYKNNVYGKGMGGGVTIKTQEAQNEWQGWGTALKPSYEPIIVARKPFKVSLVDNVMKYGVGGLNIDECRVGNEERTQFSGRNQSKTTVYNSYNQDNAHYETVQGRFPANTILDTEEGEEWRRYFYCAKASKKDRDEGLEEFEKDITDDGRNKPIDNPYLRGKTMRRNTHPTVKPTALMQYLVRLVAPKGATILDPFMGSGSTGKAVMYENKERNAGYKFIGIEKDGEYCKIAEARIKHAGGE
jgi:site-specific DNA-methyltransferase (adenine-specific)